MTSIRVMLSRIGALFSRRRRDARLEAEIAAHLDLLTDDYLRRGLTPAAARAAARREFGGVDQVKEICRERRSVPFAEDFARDAQYASDSFAATRRSRRRQS